jgi:hypothetical protein
MKSHDLSFDEYAQISKKFSLLGSIQHPQNYAENQNCIENKVDCIVRHLTKL